MNVGAVEALKELFRPIQGELDRVEGEIRRMTATPSAPLERLFAHISRFSGKRLRPALTIVTGGLVGAVRPVHHTVAAIIELIHTATLVHDDILDESAMRRRVETVNHRIGSETAVLLGDYIFATCFKEAASLEDRFASRYLSEIVGIVCRGEILQVHHRNDFDLEEETYFRIIEDKTAALYVAALRCGAVLAGGSEALAGAAAAYGRKVGCAFQIVDDILDLTGEEADVGKSLGTDLEKAKMTLPLLRLRDRVDGEARRRLREAVLSNDARERRAVLPMLHESGAVASARETAERLVREARGHLAHLPDRPERALLERAAEYVLRRSW